MYICMYVCMYVCIYQIFLSPQVERHVIISNTLVYTSCRIT